MVRMLCEVCSWLVQRGQEMITNCGSCEERGNAKTTEVPKKPVHEERYPPPDPED